MRKSSYFVIGLTLIGLFLMAGLPATANQATATSEATMSATSAATTVSGGPAATNTPAAAPTNTSVPASAGNQTLTQRAQRAEIRFMTEAMDLNQLAVDLSNDCLAKAKDSDVLALCQTMSTAHAADIGQLHDMLLTTYNIDYMPVSMLPAAPAAAAATEAAATPAASAGTGVAGPGVFVILRVPQGSNYDVAWLEAMSDVHNDLVNGANRVLTFQISTALRTAVQKMRTTATTEIGTMQNLIAKLGGNK